MATGNHQTLTEVLTGSLTENKQHGLRYFYYRRPVCVIPSYMCISCSTIFH